MATVTQARSATLLYLLVISSSYPLATWLADRVDPLMTVLSRFWIASAVLFLIYIFTKQRLPSLPKGSEWWRILLLAAPLALYFISTFSAAKTQSPVVLAVLFTVAPLTPVLVGFLRKQNASLQIIIAMFLGASAAVYLALSRGSTNLGDTQIDSWLLIYCLSCLLFTANPALIKNFGSGMPLLWRSFWILLLSGIIMLMMTGISSVFNLGLIDTSVPDLNGWFVLIWIGIICTAIPMFLYQYAAHTLNTVEMGGWHYALPVLVMIQQTMWLQGSLSSGEVGASMVITLALLLLTVPLSKFSNSRAALSLSR